METLYIFLIKASAGIALFYLVFWIFFRKETFYTANRWFLIAALMAAVLIPLFPLQYSVFIESQNSNATYKTISDTFKNIPVIGNAETATAGIKWQQVVFVIYITGLAIFLFRLLSQTLILIHLIIRYRIKSMNGIRIVENEKYGLPFSFFNVIFINPKFHTQADLPEILAHEKVHIRENHWFDLLFIELLTVIFWFNPFIWLFERSIKQNHEYLADKGVLDEGHTVARYQALLVNQLMGMQIIGITNNLNFALSTNRLKMMTKKKTSAKRLFRFSLTLPVLAILLYAFAEPIYHAKDVETIDSEITITEKETGEKALKITGKVVMRETGEPLPGAAIILKGTTLGTVADIDGSFKLDVPIPEADINKVANYKIVVSFVGLRTIEKLIGAVNQDLDNLKPLKMTFKMEESVVSIGLAKNLIPVKEKEKLVKGNAAKMVPPPPPPPPKGLQKEIFYVVEDMPQYPGGSDALNNYAFKMQQKISKEKGIKGKAKVLFTVDTKGRVSEIKVVESDNDGAKKGAYMIANEMADWTPGKQRGKPVSVKYLLPVEFK